MLLVRRQEGCPACKKLSGGVNYLERGADLHMARLMPLPLTVSCFSKIQTSFTFLVPAHPVPERLVPDKGPLNGCVCVCVLHSLHRYSYCTAIYGPSAIAELFVWMFFEEQ